MPIQSQHARSANPLFDQLVAAIRPSTGRPLTPITTATRWIDRSTATSRASTPSRATAPSVSTPPGVRRDRPGASTSRPVPAAPAPAPAKPPTEAISIERLVGNPLSTDGLTDSEREIVAEMGGTVARLILQMLDDDGRAASRR